MYSEVLKENAVLRRSAVVNQLYGDWKLALEEKNSQKKSRREETRNGIPSSAT